MSSKSREIRRHCCEFLDQLLHTWPTHCLEKHVGILGEAIKKGIADADPDARQFARKYERHTFVPCLCCTTFPHLDFRAFWGFADHFKDHADQLLNTLDSSYRRLLQAGEMSNSSSSNSLNMKGGVSSTLPRFVFPKEVRLVKKQ